ncbi:MAG: hypothetical protein HY298_13920 [Verrucomicrobia bacterium]|nr:hypothetical protein [Verrucomicrobiota bacterium]
MQTPFPSVSSLAALLASLTFAAAQSPSVTIGTFKHEVRREFTTADGLPANAVICVVLQDEHTVLAGTTNGLARFVDGHWSVVKATFGAPVEALATGSSAFVSKGQLFALDGEKIKPIARLPLGVKVNSLGIGGGTYLATDRGLFEKKGDKFEPVTPLNETLGTNREVFAVADGPDFFVGAASGLFQREAKKWTRLFPSDKKGRSWAPINVRGVAYDSLGRLWFASPQGVGRFDKEWTLFTGAEGLPYNDFRTMAVGPDGVVWFGTRMGAIRFDGKNWEYRQGRRWLPDDVVNEIAITREGHAWIATSAGLSFIERRSMTLSEKAKFYEDQIDALHRRTPWEYVLEVYVAKTGSTNQFTQTDSDNDGLWTSMYGAGECFAYGATKNPLAKNRAQKAFEALRWLGQVTQGGEHSPPPGYVARTILPTSGRDPNIGRIEGDKREHERDPLWKVYEPRWPKSKDGQWYWKSDTSSDELDGHFFFYPLYYDLVCETEAEKARVREHLRALMDHIISHDFNLIDHDGTPTRWGVYNPDVLNHDPRWSGERGIRSLSLLSYLAATEHVTGDSHYRQLINVLCEKYAFDTNLRVPKPQQGVGTGNQSDDEMAFMSFYNLMKYGNDPKLTAAARYPFYTYWTLESPEMNPFFNFVFGASTFGRQSTDDRPARGFNPSTGWLEDAVETLKRFPLDRFDWRHTNSHRLDLVLLRPEGGFGFARRGQRSGYRVNGKVIPVDERFFNHWNHNPFALDTGGDGRELADGAVFLLPYYMGLYHGFIKDESIAKLNRATPRRTGPQ